MLCLVFSKRPIISTLVSSVQRSLFRKSCVLFRFDFTNLSCAAMFFLERRGFLLPPFQTSPTCSWSLTLNMLTKARRVWDVALGFLAVSHCIAWSDYGGNLLGRLLLGRLTTVMSVFHLWIIFLTVEWWTPNSLEIVLHSSKIDRQQQIVCLFELKATYKSAEKGMKKKTFTPS